MVYDLFIQCGKTKLYWNSYLHQWVDNVESSTPYTSSELTLEGLILNDLPFAIQAEPAMADAI